MADYYVDGAVGNDANSGTAEGVGNALATINAGIAKFATSTDNTLHVKASATYAEAVVHNKAGSSLRPQRIHGYTTTPGDGGKITINASGNTYGISCAVNYCEFANIIVDGATSHGFFGSFSDNQGYYNCISKNNGGDGFVTDDYSSFHACEALSNTGSGIDAGRYSSLYNCIMGDNTLYGYDGTDNVGNLLYGCTLYGNGPSTGTRYEARCSYGTNFVNCTIDGVDGDTFVGTHYGIYGIAGPANILNCALINCGTAIYVTGYWSASGGGANAFYNNTTDITTWDPEYNPEGNVTADPKFADEANHDYTPESDSPLLKEGRAGVDIGAIQYDWTEGGGGRVVLTG